MKHPNRTFFACASLLACGALTLSSYALAAKPAAKKPAPKKPAATKTGNHATLGTKQLNGDQAQLNETYTLGKENPLNITVTSVAYSCERIAIGERVYTPKANEKLLVINLTFHNPVNREQYVRFDTVQYLAVDAKDVNREGVGLLGVPETKEDFAITLKPAQKKNAYTYIIVPADVVIPKLVIKSSDDLVLRYDLRDKIKPLAGPCADPGDKTGTRALAEVPTKLNEVFQVGDGSEWPSDVQIENVAFSDATKLGDHELEEGKRYLILTGKVTSWYFGKELYRFDSFKPVVKTTDDEAIAAEGYMLHPTADRSIEHSLGLGQSGRFRMFFQIPKDSKVKSMVFHLGDEDRSYVFDISNVS